MYFKEARILLYSLTYLVIAVIDFLVLLDRSTRSVIFLFVVLLEKKTQHFTIMIPIQVCDKESHILANRDEKYVSAVCVTP